MGENTLAGQYILGPGGCQYIDRSIYILGFCSIYLPENREKEESNMVEREADQYMLCNHNTLRTIYMEKFQ